MRILGLDCGSRVTGFGVIDSEGRSRRSVAFGAIRLSAKKEMGERLREVADEIDRIVEEYRPDEAALEDVFVRKNVKSALALAHVRGAAMLSAARAGLSVSNYSPGQVKSSVVGYGNAEKTQVRKMVKILLGIRGEVKPTDASDALAVAYCHASHRHLAGLGR